jgi:ribonuclease BN (tRNA processing enzyme)
MELTFLGTGAGNFQGGHRHLSGAVIEGILLDCGAGTTGRLYDAALFNRIDGILISHLHTDHFAGLFDFLLHTLITGRKRPLTIVSPPGLSPVLRAMNDARAMVRDPATLYELRLIEALHPETTIGQWRVRSVPLDHIVYNLGYLLTSDDASLFYTGDTRSPWVPDGLRADFVIHESTYADRHADLASAYGHSTGSQAAQAAARLGARRLFLTHIGSQEGTEAEIVHEARASFPDSTLAEDRSRHEL